MAQTLQQLQAWRDALEGAKYSGAQSITVDGQTTVLRSIDEINRTLRDVESQIACITGRANRRPMHSSIDLRGSM